MLGIRKRYWIVAGAQLGIGLIFYYFVYGYSFTGLLLCGLAAVTMAFGVLNAVKRFVLRTVFLCILILASLMAVITATNIHKCGSGSESPKADYAIVLGAGVDGTEPSIALRERTLAAKDYANQYPEAVLVLTGGQGEEDEISEARCMYELLRKEGIPASRMLLEEKAANTEENLAFSLALIGKEDKDASVCIISSEYHLLRAQKYAQLQGTEPLLYPARTENRLYYCNMLLREVVGIWKLLLDQ